MYEFLKTIEQIKALHNRGLSATEIAKEVKLPVCTVRNALISDMVKEIEKGSKQKS